MQSYGGSFNNPKMEHGRNSYRRKGINMGNIIGDPFALATTSIATLAWIIILFGSIFGYRDQDIADDIIWPTYCWFTLVFNFFLILGIFFVIASDSAQTYHVAVVGYLAVGLVGSTSSINNLIYSGVASMEATAAGYILLSMVTIIWIFYFGSAPSAVPRAYIDSFALTKESALPAHHMSRQTMNHNGPPSPNAYGSYNMRPETSASGLQPPQMYTAQLNGLENPARQSQIPQGFSSNNIPKPQGTEGEIVPPTEYPYRAKAIFSYEANPDDANEISFSKHEVLEISDVSGRWWQARKDTGETGIAPSNYLILL
ncbi:hypothetical protein QBC32DRAFT_136022 [Pseudoneurospora amorphoporcata]|uniref:SH3 domain-containing protein n=1 Tax=Pseudoneurospora amorphoporcata TaxID=241081 RepID=A0AAN6NV94_9PEZI|nr:hypothetical protein QBC32DRAFT_136022 [Pseudoneurospora amorphoporcata]